jgi:hypothetical protein
MRTALAIALAAALALPSAGVVAQAVDAVPTPPAAASMDPSSMPVPVWNRDSGELQAVTALPPHWARAGRDATAA